MISRDSPILPRKKPPAILKHSSICSHWPETSLLNLTLTTSLKNAQTSGAAVGHRSRAQVLDRDVALSLTVLGVTCRLTPLPPET